MTVRLTRRGKYAAVAATVAAGFTLGLALPVHSDPAPNVGTPEPLAWAVTPDRDVPEDTALWNCWTMGDQSCGDMPTIPGEGFTRGVVLPKAADTGKATIAWSNGVVWTDAARWHRYVAWRGCVAEADGGDASMHACDDAWQYDDERFDMSEAHCYAEAWIGDDPDARMLAVCTGDDQ